jgi:hypothetical protein
MSIRKIAVLTSGGDAPGMNAAIRAVVRTGIAKDWDVFGVRNGYAGLVEGQIELLGARSARLPGFQDEPVRAQGLANLSERGIDGLVVIGGNGTQTGALALSRSGLPVVGVASTIDNDLAGSEITIGVDTALNIALEAIDRLRVTASSHKRAFLVEVMGRNCGYLALMAGIAGGADSVVIPEADVEPEAIAACAGRRRRGRAAQRGQAGPALRSGKRAPGVRPARHHARPRAAGRRAGRVRSPAGHPPGGGRHGLPGTRRARPAGGAGPRRDQDHAPGRDRRPDKPIDLHLLELQKVLAQ